MGLAVAYAAQLFAVPCSVVIPTNSAKPQLLEKLRLLGATVEIAGENFSQASSHVETLLAADPEAVYVHPYADRATVVGQGTLALELYEALGAKDKAVDLIVGSVGGGGLMGGVTAAWRCLEQRDGSANPTVFTTVETLGADCWYQSAEAGRPVTLPKITSVATTLGASSVSLDLFDILSSNVKHAARITDRLAVAAMSEFLENEKILLEPSSAASIAALPHILRTVPAQRVCVIVCGSNASLSDLIGLSQSHPLH